MGERFEQRQPKYGIRKTVAGAMAAAVALVGVYKAGESYVSQIHELHNSPIELGNEENKLYIVQGGDTPWTIARNYLGEDADVRPLVNGIREQIGKNGFLMPGDVIELPSLDQGEDK